MEKPLTQEQILSDVKNAIKKIDTHLLSYEYHVVWSKGQLMCEFESYDDAISYFCKIAGDASLYRVIASRKTLLKEKK